MKTLKNLVLMFGLIFAQQSYSASLMSNQLFTNLLEFEAGSSTPIASEWVNIYIRPYAPLETPLETRVFLRAKIDGVDALLLHPLNDMWIFSSGPTNAVGSHTLSVAYYLEEVESADAIFLEIKSFDLLIGDLRSRLILEEDETEKVIIQQDLNSKIALRASRLSALELTRTFIATENFNYIVSN